ncbi:MAG: Uma2 family endonuclease [Vicinamibacteria bacterium]
MERGTLIPVEEYLSTSYRPDREYVDGTLLERNVGEWDHSKLQMLVSAYLYNRRKVLGVHVVPEQRVQVTPTRFRVPDVCVVAGREPDEQILTSPPFLCVEILSRDDRMSEMQERINDYLSFGVRYVWVIDPRTKRAHAHTSEGSHEVKDALRTENPEILVPLEELFAGSDG